MAAIQGPTAATPRQPSLKRWWHSFTRKDSATYDTASEHPLENVPYKPRHAQRDALLSVPIAERQRSDGTRVHAVKRVSSMGQLAVHPNRDLSMEGLSSISSRRRWSRSQSWSPLGSSAHGSPMHSIREDDSDEAPARDASFSTAPEISKPLSCHHAPASERLGSSSGQGSSSGWSTTTSSASPHTSKSSSTSSADAKRQRQREANALILRQLQHRVSPPPSPMSALRQSPEAGPTALHQLPPPLAQGRTERRGYFGHGVRPDLRAPRANAADAPGRGGETASSSAKGKGKAADQAWQPHPAQRATAFHSPPSQPPPTSPAESGPTASPPLPSDKKAESVEMEVSSPPSTASGSEDGVEGGSSATSGGEGEKGDGKYGDMVAQDVDVEDWERWVVEAAEGV